MDDVNHVRVDKREDRSARAAEPKTQAAALSEKVSRQAPQKLDCASSLSRSGRDGFAGIVSLRM